MKKLFALLLLLALLTAAACAASLSTDCVYRVVFAQANGNPVYATAFVSAWDTLVCPLGSLTLQQLPTVEDVRGNAVPVTEVLQLGDDFLQLKVQGDVSAPLRQISDSAEDVTVVTATATGMALSQAKRPAVNSRRADDTFLIFSAQELLPGAILLNADNAVTGFVVGTWAESPDAYIARPVEALKDLETREPVLQPAPTPTVKPETGWSDRYTLKQEKNLITVVPDTDLIDSDAVKVVVYVREGNITYDYVVLKKGDGITEVPFLLIPGESYRIGLWVSADGSLPRAVGITALRSVTYPAVDGVFTAHGYQEKEAFFGLMTNMSLMNTGAQAEPVTITRALLEEQCSQLVVQVNSTYQVQGSDQCSLLSVLRTPEGYTFTEQGSFLFDASMQAADVWHINLANLLTCYSRTRGLLGGYASGTYSICWYFDDLLVGQLEFTID